MIKLKNNTDKTRGIALFVSILLSMGLSVISLSAMVRLSSVSRTTGMNMREKQLLMYAESAVNIASAEVQAMALADPEPIGNNTVYRISGTAGDFSYKFYPRDVTVSPPTFYDRTLFAYRAVARRFAGEGNHPPGFKSPLDAGGQCFDITVDVREVIYIDDANYNVNADSSFATASGRYYLGNTKTVGVISCFRTAL